MNRNKQRTAGSAARKASASSGSTSSQAASRRWMWAAGAVGVAVLALVAYGLWTYQSGTTATLAGGESASAGGGRQYGLVEGAAAPVPIAQALSGDTARRATVRGKVVEMGPTMGCWMIVDDGTGQVMVQTEPMVYVDQAVKGSVIEATGQVVTVQGGMGYSGKRPALLTTGISTVS